MNFFKQFKNLIRFQKTTNDEQETNNEQTVETPQVELGTLKVVELKTMAKTMGLKGYSALNKAQLVELLNERKQNANL